MRHPHAAGNELTAEKINTVKAGVSQIEKCFDKNIFAICVVVKDHTLTRSVNSPRSRHNAAPNVKPRAVSGPRVNHVLIHQPD